MNNNLSAVSARTAVVLRQQTEKIASLEQENADLRSRLTEFERGQEYTALANEMEEKGLNSDMTLDEKVASIRAATSLESVREAIKMASAGYIRMGHVSDEPGRGSTDSLTAFCIGAG